MQGKVYINGTITAPAEARISVFDRGFLYGDSVFETLRIYNRVPFALAEHLERLYNSGKRVGFALPWTSSELIQACEKTLCDSNLKDAYLRMIATRGTGPMGLDPALAQHPTLIVMVLPLPHLPAAMYEIGRSAWLVSVSRHDGSHPDPRAKTGNYLNSVLATQEARDHDAEEAIMLDAAGRVAEASAANIFVMLEGVWCTPPLSVGILSGITRKTVLRLCHAAKIDAQEKVLWPSDLERADEMFLCASVRQIVPLVKLNGRLIGIGKVGAATRRLMQLYTNETQGIAV